MTAFAAILAAATFTRAMERIVSVDPIKSQSIYDSRAVQLVYETPLAVDYEARPYRLVPGACELPEVSPDGLVYRFGMRKRVGGSAPSAEDVVRSLERLRDPNNASPGGWTMKSVKSIRAVGDVVEIKLSKPLHVFPWMMAMAYSGIMLEDGAGTGPFELARWRKGHEMVFRRRHPEPGRFDEVRYLVVGDVSTQWLMFLKGELDFLGDISRDNWDAVVDGDGRLDPFLARQGVRLYESPTLDVLYIGMNMKDPVLGPNAKLRQALTCAFDFPTWRKFFNNRVEAADGPVPPGVAGRLEGPPPYRFNLERAKRLLAEAGYAGGLDPATGRRLVLTLSIGRANQESREAGELLASFFARIGVKLDLSFGTWSSYLQAVNEGRVQMYMMGWVGDYPDAENFLQLFHSKNASPGPNHSNYSNPAFDSVFDAAMDAKTEERREELWRECQRIIREDCPWIFTHYPKAYSLVRPGVEGYVPGCFPYGEETHFKTGGPEWASP